LKPHCSWGLIGKSFGGSKGRDEKKLSRNGGRIQEPERKIAVMGERRKRETKRDKPVVSYLNQQNRKVKPPAKEVYRSLKRQTA